MSGTRWKRVKVAALFKKGDQVTGKIVDDRVCVVDNVYWNGHTFMCSLYFEGKHQCSVGQDYLTKV